MSKKSRSRVDPEIPRRRRIAVELPNEETKKAICEVKSRKNCGDFAYVKELMNDLND